MVYRLRDNMTTLKSRFNKTVEVKLPCAKQYSQCTKAGGKSYPIWECLKNPKKSVDEDIDESVNKGNIDVQEEDSID